MKQKIKIRVKNKKDQTLVFIKTKNMDPKNIQDIIFALENFKDVLIEKEISKFYDEEEE